MKNRKIVLFSKKNHFQAKDFTQMIYSSIYKRIFVLQFNFNQFSGKLQIKTDTIPQSLPVDLNFFGLAR